jgi:hypothetical protein
MKHKTATQEYFILPHVMYVEFYLSLQLVGDKFHYNTSVATPFLKQLYSGDNGVYFVYKWIKEVIGWTTQQYRNAIDSAFKANYTLCVIIFFTT